MVRQFLSGVVGGAIAISLVVGCSSASSTANEAAPAAQADAGGKTEAPTPPNWGSACSCDSECVGAGEQAGVCFHGVCMLHASAACSSEGSTDECPENTRCFTFANEPLCAASCEALGETGCAGKCDIDGTCVNDENQNCDSSCATHCSTDDKPCGETVKAGRCGIGGHCANGTCISKSCPDWRCTDGDCLKIVPMPGPTAETSDEAKAKGYYKASPAKYSFLRKDLTQLVQYMACEVRYRFPGTTPLGLIDLTQADGKTPGTDVGNPGHPNGTHMGDDIDIAYYQTDGHNNPQIICGDGSDTNYNGQPGKYNDGEFCTTQKNIVDWDRELWKFAKFSETTKTRVYGVDQTLSDDYYAGTQKLKLKKVLSPEVLERMGHVAYGAENGWALHHHHSHMSFVR